MTSPSPWRRPGSWAAPSACAPRPGPRAAVPQDRGLGRRPAPGRPLAGRAPRPPRVRRAVRGRRPRPERLPPVRGDLPPAPADAGVPAAHLSRRAADRRAGRRARRRARRRRHARHALAARRARQRARRPRDVDSAITRCCSRRCASSSGAVARRRSGRCIAGPRAGTPQRPGGRGDRPRRRGRGLGARRRGRRPALAGLVVRGQGSRLRVLLDRCPTRWCAPTPSSRRRRACASTRATR